MLAVHFDSSSPKDPFYSHCQESNQASEQVGCRPFHHLLPSPVVIFWVPSLSTNFHLVELVRAKIIVTITMMMNNEGGTAIMST